MQGKRRLYETRYNNQNCLMKIVEFESGTGIVVEFQDKYKTKVHTQYQNFIKGEVKNPYHPSVYGVGVIGVKYPVSINSKRTKEYCVWHSMIKRCYDNKTKERQPAYKKSICCEEWLLYENFYEWIHSQENFEKWLNGKRWALEKDILVKKNYIYSPQNCCLVPQNVNCLFLKREALRGDSPIGVKKIGEKYQVSCGDSLTGKSRFLGIYDTVEKAFEVYKKYKEDIIKKVAQIEFDKGNITKRCYDAMVKYQVEMTD